MPVHYDDRARPRNPRAVRSELPRLDEPKAAHLERRGDLDLACVNAPVIVNNTQPIAAGLAGLPIDRDIRRGSGDETVIDEPKNLAHIGIGGSLQRKFSLIVTRDP